MPDPDLVAEFEIALHNYRDARDALAPLLVRMALANAGEALPGAHAIETEGCLNEDWIPTLRVMRVIGRAGTVLFDSSEGHADRNVEDTIDIIGSEYLDELLALTGDTYMGHQTIVADETAHSSEPGQA